MINFPVILICIIFDLGLKIWVRNSELDHFYGILYPSLHYKEFNIFWFLCGVLAMCYVLLKSPANNTFKILMCYGAVSNIMELWMYGSISNALVIPLIFNKMLVFNFADVYLFSSAFVWAFYKFKKI